MGDEGPGTTTSAGASDSVGGGNERQHVSLLQCFGFSLMLCGYSLLGVASGVCLFWIPFLNRPQGQANAVNLERSEPMMVVDGTHEPFFQSTAGHLNFDLPIFFYLPSMVIVYLRLSPWETTLCMGPTLAGYLVFAWVRWERGGSSIVTQVASLLCSVFFLLSVKYLVLPRQSKVFVQIVRQMSIAPVAILLMQFIGKIPAGNDTAEIVLVCVMYPIMREAFYLLTRLSAKAQTLSYNINGTRTVRRNMTWGFCLWIQISMAIFVRLSFTKLKSMASLVFVTVFQSVWEISMRLTLPQRDRLASRLWQALPCTARSSQQSIVMPSEASTGPPGSIYIFSSPSTSAKAPKDKSGAGPTPKAVLARTESQRRFSLKNFISTLLVGECLSEYIAIWIAPAIIILGHKSMLDLPLTYYNNLERPFDDPLDLEPVARWFALQLSTELFVDTVSSYLEIRNGYNLIDVWRARHNGFFLVLIAAGACGSAASFYMLGFVDRLDDCVGRDTCYCADGNGLQVGGLKERYCLRLYPDDNGYPNHTIPL